MHRQAMPVVVHSWVYHPANTNPREPFRRLTTPRCSNRAMRRHSRIRESFTGRTDILDESSRRPVCPLRTIQTVETVSHSSAALFNRRLKPWAFAVELFCWSFLSTFSPAHDFSHGSAIPQTPILVSRFSGLQHRVESDAPPFAHRGEFHW